MKPITEDKWFEKGCELLEQRLNEKAVKLFEKSVKKSPHNELAWFKLGVALAGSGKLRDSVQCFEKALIINPDYEKALFQKAYSIERLGNLEEANEMYDKVISRSSDEMSIINATRKKILNVLRLEKRGITKIPQNKYEKAMRHAIGGEYEDALLIFESLIAVTPDRFHLLLPYAISLLRAQNYEKALELTKSMLTKDENNYEILMLLGEIYCKMSDYQKAVETYEQTKLINNTEAVRSAISRCEAEIWEIQREKKKNLEARCLKGRFCLTSHDYEEGRNHFQEILKEDPSYDDAWLFQGLSYLLEKDFDKAVESLNKALELRPKSYRALMMLGGALYFLEKYDEAIEKFNMVLERSPDYEEAKEFKEITTKAKNGEVNELILTKIYYLFAASFRYSELTGKFLKSSRRF